MELPLLRLYGDWATKTLTETYVSSLISTLSPLLRLVVGLVAIWAVAGMNDKPRLNTALLFGVTCGFLTGVELSSLLDASGSPTDVVHSSSGVSDSGGQWSEYVSTSTSVAPFASVALNILALTAFLVGMATGSLLPRLFGGFSLGGVAGLLICGLAGTMSGGFPVVAGGLALVFGGVSCR